MNSGGGDMITLEDLESVSEEQLSDSPEEEEEEQGRLLQYWRDVARGHQVEVPTGTITTTAGRVSIHSRRSGRVSRQFITVIPLSSATHARLCCLCRRLRDTLPMKCR